ncbi:hypothetical protein EAF04_003163 [Stromatinia cepivora]|nr:hypothetical protein EAF04_003163 [Stromatinia cepivora]
MALGESWLVRGSLVGILKEAMGRFGEEDLNYYIGPGGTSALLSAFSTFFNQYFHPRIPITSEQVISSAGATTALDGLLYAICDSGDSIILPSPFWGGYIPFTQSRHNLNILSAAVPWRDSLSNSIVDAIKIAYHNASDPSRVKAFLMADPHNPTGQRLEKGLHYISDELFAMSDFGEEKEFVSALALVEGGEGEESPMHASKVHVIYSMSKDFGAAGIGS